MANQAARFNQLLLTLLIVLYVVSLGAFSYVNWMADSEHVLWIYAINALILSIPLVLFYGSIYVLINAWREHDLSGQISPQLAKVIYWAPRLAAILITFFVTLFSLDVFEMEASLLELLGAFVIHSLPSIILILFLVVAWRRPVVGFIGFLLAGLFFLRFVIFGQGLLHFLLFSGPLLLISALFFADWRWQRSQPNTSLDAAA